MTLPEIERLVRRIEDAMEKPGATGALAKLAADFQTVARAAALRLGQCASMLATGNEHQALQLAETQPALLDILTLLSFRRSPDWRALCQEENLPAPEAFDIKPVRQLSELYAKGIDKDHALYREYRRAVMLNEEARALAILRSITRLNPNDANARVELERLEKKQRADKIRKLEQLLRAKGDAAEIAGLTDEVEAFSEAQQSAMWHQAQVARAKHILQRAQESRRTNDVGDLQQFLKRLATWTPFLEEAERADLTKLQEWSDADTARRREAFERKAAIEQLAGAVARDQRGATLADLRGTTSALERAWRQVEHFRAELPGDLAARVEKHRRELDLRINRQVRTKRRLAVAAVLLVAVICLGAAWFAFQRHESVANAAQLRTFIAERRVADAEATLGHPEPKFSGSELARARQDAEQFVRRERAAKAVVDQAITVLDASARFQFTNAPTEQISEQFASVATNTAALAPEFRASSESALAKSRAAWQSHLDQQRAARSRSILQAVDATTALGTNQMQYSIPASAAAEIASKLGRQLAPARLLANAPVAGMRPTQEALFKLQSLDATIDKYGREATNFLKAQALLASTNLASYTNGLQLLASSGFTPASQRQAVVALASMNLSPPALIPSLLGVSLAEGFDLSQIPARRIPEAVLPAERDLQRKLRDDENIQSVSRMDIEAKALPPEDPRRKRTVFVRGELQRKITRRSGQIYDPAESLGQLKFGLKELSSLEFVIEELSPTAEKELYERCGLPRLLDSNTGLYQVSLLQTLDDINQDRRASPLFRAWLFLRVCEMIDAQPLQWGASFSPALTRDRANLVRLGANQLRSGDWFVPMKIASIAAPLAAHFEHAGLQSYVRESTFYKKLLPKAAAAGIALVGHADANGSVALNDATIERGPVFCFTAANTGAAMIFEKVSPNEAPQPIARPMAFSPLFTFAGNAPALVDDTLQELGYSAAALGFPETLPSILKTP